MDYSHYGIDVTGESGFARFFRSLPKDDEVRKKLDKMLDALKVNPEKGDQIPKKQWPVEYKREGFRNVFKYNVDDSMRATYTIRTVGNLRLEVAVIEFFSTHKEYERRFHY